MKKQYEQPTMDILDELVDVVTSSTGTTTDPDHDNSYGDFDSWE